MIGRTCTIAKKELIHIIRDPRTLAVMLLIPLVQLVLLAYAATTDVEHLRTAVLDADRTQESRALIDAFDSSNYFDIASCASGEQEMAQMVNGGRVRAGLIIPAGYGGDAAAGRTAGVTFVIDGSDPTTASMAFATALQVGQAHGIQLIEHRLSISTNQMAALEVHPRVWYNPDVKSVNFVVPGLIATIVFILTVFMTGPTVVQEREQGTIEQLMVTPIPPLEMVVGKVAPYIVVAFLEIIEALALGAFRFGMPIKGSIFLLLALSCVFLMTLLGIGVFASSVAKTYREAVLMVPFIMLPSIFFSGFLFPLEAMPGVLQGLSYLIPRRHTLTIIRGIILKGVGLTTLKWEVMALVAFGMLILAFAATHFHKRIE